MLKASEDEDDDSADYSDAVAATINIATTTATSTPCSSFSTETRTSEYMRVIEVSKQAGKADKDRQAKLIQMDNVTTMIMMAED